MITLQDKSSNSDFDSEFCVVGEGIAIHPEQTIAPELLELPISRAIFRLAGPAMTSMMLLMIFALIDIWWIGKVSAEAVAGVSAASFICWALEAIATLVSTGVNAMVARFIGAQNAKIASKVTTQGLLLAFLMSLVFGLGGLLLQHKTFILMGLRGYVLQSANAYMKWILIGLGGIFGAFAVDATFRGMGDTKTPMKVFAITLSFNAILDPFLIFGWGPFPEMGAAGAALATAIAHVLAVISMILILQKRPVKLSFEKGILRLLDFSTIWRISRIGAPIAFSGLVFSLTYMGLTRIISDFGAEPLAALGIGHRIEGIAFFACVGFSVASATLVGQNLGAKRSLQAAKSAWLSVVYISLILFIVSVGFYIFAQDIFRFFVRDSEVIREGVNYLRIVALFEIFLGFEVVLEGAFGGAGNSVPPMLISVPLTLSRIPVGYVLAYHFGMGSNGVWWMIGLTTGLKGLLMAFWFKHGKWKNQRI